MRLHTEQVQEYVSGILSCIRLADGSEFFLVLTYEQQACLPKTESNLLQNECIFWIVLCCGAGSSWWALSSTSICNSQGHKGQIQVMAGVAHTPVVVIVVMKSQVMTYWTHHQGHKLEQKCGRASPHPFLRLSFPSFPYSPSPFRTFTSSPLPLPLEVGSHIGSGRALKLPQWVQPNAFWSAF